MDKNKGEITALRVEKDGVDICIAHGEKKKKPDNSKNDMCCEYDERPTTHIHMESADDFKLGDKVEIKLMKMGESEEAEE